MNCIPLMWIEIDLRTVKAYLKELKWTIKEETEAIFFIEAPNGKAIHLPKKGEEFLQGLIHLVCVALDVDPQQFLHRLVCYCGAIDSRNYQKYLAAFKEGQYQVLLEIEKKRESYYLDMAHVEKRGNHEHLN